MGRTVARTQSCVVTMKVTVTATKNADQDFTVKKITAKVLVLGLMMTAVPTNLAKEGIVVAR